MDLPSHPDADDTNARPSATGANWRVRVLVGLIGLMVALVIVLHLTGVVGPAGR
jgi:hypothetical protein